MKIQVLEAGNMVTLGSGLLRVLQNSHTPKADLFIRESIQNSLDAALKETSNVQVNLNVGTFESEQLTSHLEVVGPVIEQDYPSTQKFLSIQDKNTTGLTGPISRKDVVGQNFGNLRKLVYELAKPQENKESGGSWGYGKTIYYRMGIGLVLYYSRIKIEDEDEEITFEERLSVVMVEDENNSKAVIPPADGSSTRSGIAWWGDIDEYGESIPITNEEEIRKVLSIFSLAPYSGEETGTTIVIPYIDEDEILGNNSIESNNSASTKDMYVNLSNYLEFSVQRWYSPRLRNNKNIFDPKHLRVSVNEKDLNAENMHDYFHLIRDMYNYALAPHTFTEEESKRFIREPISIMSRESARIESGEVGYVVYGKFEYRQLGMTDPYDTFNPYYLSNVSNVDIEERPAILTYTRKPGMLINYEVETDWVNGIISKNKAEFIVGIFVLRSDRIISFEKSEESIEEYVRKGEEADHVSWEDHQEFGDNPAIIRRIKNNVKGKISSNFEETPEEKYTTTDARLGLVAAQVLLPPQGFGKAPGKGVKPKRSVTGSVVSRQNNSSVEINYENAIFESERVLFPYTVKIIGEGISNIKIDLKIKQDSRTMTLEKYEEEFEKNAPISISFLNGEGKTVSYLFGEETDGLILPVKTANGKIGSLIIRESFPKGEIISGFIGVSSKVRNIVPQLNISVGGDYYE